MANDEIAEEGSEAQEEPEERKVEGRLDGGGPTYQCSCLVFAVLDADEENGTSSSWASGRQDEAWCACWSWVVLSP
jgi:hypothetical protein